MDYTNNYMEHQDIAYHIPLLPKNKKERIQGQKYMKLGEICIWDGECLNCKHNFRRDFCKLCHNF